MISEWQQSLTTEAPRSRQWLMTTSLMWSIECHSSGCVWHHDRMHQQDCGLMTVHWWLCTVCFCFFTSSIFSSNAKWTHASWSVVSLKSSEVMWPSIALPTVIDRSPGDVLLTPSGMQKMATGFFCLVCPCFAQHGFSATWSCVHMKCCVNGRSLRSFFVSQVAQWCNALTFLTVASNLDTTVLSVRQATKHGFECRGLRLALFSTAGFFAAAGFFSTEGFFLEVDFFTAAGFFLAAGYLRVVFSRVDFFEAGEFSERVFLVTTSFLTTFFVLIRMRKHLRSPSTATFGPCDDVSTSLILFSSISSLFSESATAFLLAFVHSDSVELLSWSSVRSPPGWQIKQYFIFAGLAQIKINNAIFRDNFSWRF